jgi:hypothetical protein
LVTFLENPLDLDLRSYGIDEGHAAELRARLTSFAVNWNSVEMGWVDGT